MDGWMDGWNLIYFRNALSETGESVIIQCVDVNGLHHSVGRPRERRREGEGKGRAKGRGGKGRVKKGGHSAAHNNLQMEHALSEL